MSYKKWCHDTNSEKSYDISKQSYARSTFKETIHESMISNQYVLSCTTISVGEERLQPKILQLIFPLNIFVNQIYLETMLKYPGQK